MRITAFLQDLWHGIKTFPIAVISSLILALFTLGLEDPELFGQGFSVFAQFHFPAVLFALIFSLWLHFRDHIEQTPNKRPTWIAVVVFAFILDLILQNFANVDYKTAGGVIIVMSLVSAVSLGVLNFSAHKFKAERILYQVAIRLVLTYVFSTIVFLGLLLALGGLNLLLNIDIPNSVYFRMAVFVQIVGATLILVSLSADMKSLDLQQGVDPLIVRLFNYILIPLTAIYVLITLAYLARSWFGEGAEAATLTWLSLGYIAFAFFTFLVGNLLPEKENTWWNPKFKRLKLAFMTLILVSMTVGTIQLILLYGFTINRLLLVLFSLWFGISMVALFINPNQVRRVFQALVLTTAFGIIVINQIPVNSQIGRLAQIIPDPNSSSSLTSEQEEEITSIVTYLLDNHPSEEQLATYFDVEFDTSMTSSYSKSAFILGDVLGISENAMAKVPRSHVFTEAIKIGSGIYKVSNIQLAVGNTQNEILAFPIIENNETKFEVQFNSSLSKIVVIDNMNGTELLNESFLPIFIDDLIKITSKDDYVTKPFTLEFTNEKMQLNLVLIEVNSSNLDIISFSMDIYLIIK